MREKRLFKWVDRTLGVPLLRLLSWFMAFGPAEPAPLGPGSRVLVIKFSAMGDTLLLLPILKALRRSLGPEGRLEMVATPVNAGVLKGLPWIDAVHVLKPAEILGAPWRVAGLALRLRRSRFDWALDFDQWLRLPALLAWASGAKGRAGFETPGQHKHVAFHRSTGNHREGHEFAQFKALAALAGLDAASVEPYNGFIARESLLGARAVDPGERPLLVIHPGAGGHRSWQREWPVERWAQFGGRLMRERGVRVALSGYGPREEGLCAEIAAGLGGPVEDGQRSAALESLVRTLCGASLVACGNTGVMHLAAGLGRPVLALHGPTSALKWGPLADAPGSEARTLAVCAQLPCSPCLNLGFEYGCPERPCMESISVDEAYAAALRVLGAP